MFAINYFHFNLISTVYPFLQLYIPSTLDIVSQVKDVNRNLLFYDVKTTEKLSTWVIAVVVSFYLKKVLQPIPRSLLFSLKATVFTQYLLKNL